MSNQSNTPNTKPDEEGGNEKTRREFIQKGAAAAAGVTAPILVEGCSHTSPRTPPAPGGDGKSPGSSQGKAPVGQPLNRKPAGPFPYPGNMNPSEAVIKRRVKWDFNRLLEEVERLVLDNDRRRRTDAKGFIDGDQEISIPMHGDRELGVVHIKVNWNDVLGLGKVRGIRLKGCMLRYGHPPYKDRVHRGTRNCGEAQQHSEPEGEVEHSIYASSSSSWPIPG